jgi:CRP/FNR family transcriptional regulator
VEKTQQIISKIPFFSGLSSPQLAAIGQIAVEQRCRRGEDIFGEGESGNGFFVVAAGQVKIYKLSPEGKEQILHVINPGEPFGEVAVFAGRSFPANAQALQDSRLLFFPRRAFVDLIARNPALALSMLAVLSKRLRRFTVQVENLSLKEVPARLASYLIVLAEEQKNETEVQLPISKGQLASLLGTIPETLSRIFARMSDQGLIEVDGRRIRLVNRNGLEEMSHMGKVSV